eukprot:GEMP01006758.1.p1 GENE.GEMP01006758.1~~GEMP01006758.1.p1  ORF type:complete len:668 (-),score=178.07 GEMP01006758.1:1628-3631(-)
MAKVGIDLGSFHSVVAKRSENGGVAEICVNDLSNRSTPTMVGLEKRRILVGEECEMRITSNLKQSATHLVESMGASEAPAEALWELEDGAIPMIFNDEEIRIHPDELMALYLQQLVSFARQSEDVAKTIAVPDWYVQEQVDVVHRAVILAKIQNVSYVRHSDALCAQYLKNGNTGSVLIVDVGFAQTTCTFATLGEDVEIERRETIKVGVNNLIDALAKLIIARVQEKHKQEVSMRSRKGFRLRQACQKALKQLSMLPVAEFHLECWLDDDVDFTMELTRDQLSEAAETELHQIQELITRIKGEDEVKVEIVGGGARAFVVQEIIANVTGVAIDNLGKGLDGSSAVASGACCCAEKNYSTFTSKEPEELELEQKLNNLKKIQEVDQKEVARLRAMNALEAYMYEAKDWCTGKYKDLMNHTETIPYLDSVSDWYLDNDMDTTEENVYTEKLEEVQAYLKEKCAAFFEKKETEKLKFEKELEELQKTTDAKEKDDHDYRQLPKTERLRMAEKNRLEGNDMFKATNYQEAIIRYQKAQSHLAKMFDMSPEEKEEMNKILLSCHLNTAQCYLKGAQEVEKSDKDKAEQIYRKVKTACNSALEVDPTNVKALFRRAIALEKIGDVDAARVDIAVALKVDPDNLELKQSEARVKRAIELQKSKAKKMYGKMFG